MPSIQEIINQRKKEIKGEENGNVGKITVGEVSPANTDTIKLVIPKQESSAVIKMSKGKLEEFMQRTSKNNLGDVTEEDIARINEVSKIEGITDDNNFESVNLIKKAIYNEVEAGQRRDEMIRKHESEHGITNTSSTGTDKSIHTEVNVGKSADDKLEEDLSDMEDSYGDISLEHSSPLQEVTTTSVKDQHNTIDVSETEKPSTSIVLDKNKFSTTNLGEINITPFNGKKLIKQRKMTRVHGKKTPVVAVSSRIYGEVAGFTSEDLITMNSNATDMYLAEKEKLSLIYSKLVNTNVPLTFDTFLRVTSLFDKEAFFFGAFKSTYGDTIKIPLTCTNPKCKKHFTETIHTDDVILSKDYKKLGEEVKEAMMMTNPTDLSESDVNKIERHGISSYHVIDIDHPSLYTYLEKTLKLIAGSEKLSNPKYTDILDLLPFIHAIYVPMYDCDIEEVDPSTIQYMELSINENNKVKENSAILLAMADELLSLSSTQLFEVNTLVAQRSNKIKSKFEIGLQDIKCPSCGLTAGNDGIIPFSIQELLFFVSIQQVKEMSMNVTNIEQ